MRILMVSGFFESHGGGIEIVAGAMARALARRGHVCRWGAAGFDSPPADPLLAPVILASWDPIERWAGLPLPLPRKAARELLEREVAEADAVIVHDALYASSLLAARFARRHGKPWLLVQHIGSIPYSGFLLRAAMGAANRFVSRPLIAAAPQVVLISDEVRRFFSGQLRPGRHALLFNGVDHELFYPPAVRARRADGRRQLLFVVRFVEKKGLRVIRALAAIRPEWDFLLAGSGPTDPASWNLANVRVLGRQSRADLAELYRAADALVLPSVGEGFPLVIQEAMASGLPVFCGLDSVAADPAARDLLHGIDVIASDPQGTAARFARAIDDAPLGIDTAAAEYARRTYDWDVNAQHVEQRLSRLSDWAALRTRAPRSA